SDRARHAHRRSHRRADRRGRYTIFRGTENSARLCPVAIDRRGHRDLHADDRSKNLAMKILLCSDGTSSAETAIQLGGSLAGPLKTQTTLLRIAETSHDERPLREALQKQARGVRRAMFPQYRGVSSGLGVVRPTIHQAGSPSQLTMFRH